jgi:hypothetical protein
LGQKIDFSVFLEIEVIDPLSVGAGRIDFVAVVAR